MFLGQAIWDEIPIPMTFLHFEQGKKVSFWHIILNFLLIFSFKLRKKRSANYYGSLLVIFLPDFTFSHANHGDRQSQGLPYSALH